MKTLLVALNSKYIHSNLAIRYLKAYAGELCDIRIEEFTINQRVDSIAAEIFRIKADIVGFSTYIWNIEEVLDISRIIKIVSPETRILLGGPEVSYDPVEILQSNRFIDIVIYGEAEETFRELITGKNVDEIDGLAYRKGDEVFINPQRPLIENLDDIPFPYSENDGLENKIVYYEASRGCPFNCSFCLSSTIPGLRRFSIDRVKRELDFLIGSGARQIKFVDRTFNADKSFAHQIMEHIAQNSKQMTSFHAEISAHLVDHEQLEFFKGLRKGLFQFEIGVQSTNQDTINAIGRITDFNKLKEVSKAIASFGNIHQHLDLIAGLPFEDYHRFSKSFDDLFEINPEKIQLGFLKLLKGSRLRDEAELHGYEFLEKAPYEVLKTKWLSYEDIIRLKDIEELVERYYNERLFKYSITHISIKYFDSAFRFFELFSDYWRRSNLYDQAHSRESLYNILFEFCKSMDIEDMALITDLIKLDFYVNNDSNKLPKAFGKTNSLEGSTLHDLLRKTELVKTYIQEELETSIKDLIKRIKVEYFSTDIFQLIRAVPPYSYSETKTAVMIYSPPMRKEDKKIFDVTKFVREVLV